MTSITFHPEIRTFHPVSGVASAQGLDVSNFQGQYNWAAAKAAIPDLAFGIFRLTEGLPSSGDNSPDPDAAWNHDQIADNGLIRGAYHFLHPSLPGKDQADYFVSMHDKLGFVQSDMLWLDNESTDGLSPGAIAACAQEFMAELKVLRPHSPMGVYTYISFADSGACNGLGGWPLWLAYPAATAPVAPPPWRSWSFWQWGQRNGTDADAFNGTIAGLDAWIASFNPPPPSLNPVKGLHVTKTGFTGLDIAWSAAPGATGYTAHATRGSQVAATVDTTATSCRLRYLRPGTTYTITVRAHPGDSQGADATLTAKTR